MARLAIVLMRFLYTLAMYLLVPVILWRLAWRNFSYPGYLLRWRERFGFFDRHALQGTIWIHAVSVGEVNAAVPLINSLMRQYPDKKFVVTTVTPTGSAHVQKLYGERVFHVYLPYDLPIAVKRFLQLVDPEIAVIMETEIWPNLYFACQRRGVPIIVANARLSDRSLRGYGPVRSLARAAIRSTTRIAAQSEQDAKRFVALGADPRKAMVIGNVKYDLQIPNGLLESARALRGRWRPERPAWIAASTHEGEELAVIQAHLQVLKRFPDALLLLAPRHPERFRPVIQLCRQYGFSTRVRSENEAAEPDTQCFVVDTLGELLLFYATCDVAFVAGSLDPIGGHNILEPVALEKPVVVGPYTFNFEEITQKMLDHHAALRIADAAGLGQAVIGLFLDKEVRGAMGKNGLAAVAQERGAVRRLLAMIDDILSKKTN